MTSLFLALAIGAQTAQAPSSARIGDYTIEGITSTRILNRQGTFVVKGRLRAVSKDRRIHLQASSIEGVLDRSGSTATLRKATLRGGVVVTFESADRSFKLATDEAVIDVTPAKAVITATVAVTIDSNGPEKGQTGHAAADHGLAMLNNVRGTYELDYVELKGAAIFEYERRMAPQVAASPLRKIRGAADTITLAQKEDGSEATLVGHARLSGNDPSLLGSVTNVRKAVVTLDKMGEIVEMNLDGDPATATVSQGG